jgi:3,4-dihydroxy 2-butanone 4-phosphate synthase/GTP cyclohydrolase II
MILLVDDEDRENEGDLVVATECISPEQVAFMADAARGQICVSVSTGIAERLRFPLQVLDNNSRFGTPFAISVDHVSVLGKGVTAGARAHTMRRIAAADATPEEFVSPGHVFPLIAHPAGVLGRRGQTEGALDLVRLAGLASTGVICEVLLPSGEVARGESLLEFARQNQVPITSIAEIAQYRVNREVAVREVSTRSVTTDFGEFTLHVFSDDASGEEHLAFVYGDLKTLPTSYAPLVRVHSECLTGDVFGSERCDCGDQLASAARTIVAEGTGIILYLRQEGRGIGLGNKIRAYALQQQQGLDTVEANVKLGFEPDERDFGVAARMLASLGAYRVRVLTNNPRKVQTLEEYRVTVVERVPIQVPASEHSSEYLRIKREKMGHLL